MKSIIFLCPFIILVFLFSCEVYPEEEEVVCLPTNMTATIIQGTNSAKIIADFHYVPDSDLLDHITWSNHQTHYFIYEESDRLSVVQQLKVKEKVREEMWYEYDLRVNGFGYPETIYEKLGSSNTRIIRYTYECI